MKIYSHYNSYYVLLCWQEKDLAIDVLLFRRHLVFITFLSSAVPFTFPFSLCLETRNHEPFFLISNFRRVLNVALFLLGNSPASKY
jgi:hypothetical protein